MRKTLQVINKLEAAGVIKGYAVGGATALLFYAEPALTFDIDVFVFLPESKPVKNFVDLGPLYTALASKGYLAEKEHVVIEGIPVQFIPVYNALVEEAVQQATVRKYEEVPIKVLTLEHLLAIMIDTNRPKDRERLSQLIETIHYDEEVLGSLLERYSLKQKWEKHIGNKQENN